MYLMLKSADLSEDGIYRYKLGRLWESSKPACGWLMLNPSTADADIDDPTIRKCIGFASRWGFGEIQVVNLYGYRSTSPKQLFEIHDPMGPKNWEHIHYVCSFCNVLIAAWGCESVIKQLNRRGLNAYDTISQIHYRFPNLQIQCLGKSPNGNPYHPLMLSYDTQRKDFFEKDEVFD